LLAYSRGDVGQTDVILRTYPGETGQWQVSSAGGSSPVWSPRGDALYYRDASGQVIRVDVRTTPEVTLGAATVIKRPFSLVARAGFDVSRDGTRLLMVEEVGTGAVRQTSLAVVQNWLAVFRPSSSAWPR
jgi:Tol biopolymer transport system component